MPIHVQPPPFGKGTGWRNEHTSRLLVKVTLQKSPTAHRRAGRGDRRNAVAAPRSTGNEPEPLNF